MNAAPSTTAAAGMTRPLVAPLFEPIRIRGLELANRIVMAPMTRKFSPRGVPGR